MRPEKLEKSCGCIILRERPQRREVLLVQSAKGRHWSFPKGHMESGEDEHATARREVLEETGLAVDIRDGFRATSHYLTRHRIPKEVVYFLASAPDTRVTIQKEEIATYAWLPISSAMRRLTYARDMQVLREAVEYIGA